MKELSELLIVLALAIIISNTASAQPKLSEQLIGSWQGTGTLMGSEATFDMRWERELGGQFLKLTFQNRRTPKDKSPIIFNATAMYSTGEEEWTGTWFDVRGISFPLKGQVDGGTLTVDWGSPDTEQGRTVYALQDDESMVVTDYILQQGSYTKFGTANYTKIDQALEKREGTVTGIGGIFFKSSDPEKSRAWYQKHLGVMSNEQGASFVWRKFNDPEEYGFTVWHTFNEEDEYFNLSEKDFMVNYRVNNLDALLEYLKAEDVEFVGEIEEYAFGRFAWILDPDGQKVELWEPNDVDYLKMIDGDGAQIHNTSN